MTDEAMSPLRRRMIEDMTVRSFNPHTQRDYIRAVSKLAAFLGRSPGTASAEDLRRFQIHLRQTGVPAPTVNTTVSALRFFCRVTLDKPEVARHLAVVPKAHRLPVVLSLDEVARFLEATSEPKYKAAFSLAYGAGLRVAEIAALKVGDIDSKRMLVRIEQGKRRKDRYGVLSPKMLEFLRDWWRIARPRIWLFEGGALLSRSLHPPRRHRQPPADPRRCGQRHLQGQGLPGRRPGPIHHHDAGDARVYPAVPHACTAQGPASHPPLRPPRQRQPRCQSRPNA
jgi:integrase/recombinase XerD